jgi:hypothetical protein
MHLPVAVVSALAASGLPALVMARGHRVEQVGGKVVGWLCWGGPLAALGSGSVGCLRLWAGLFS